MELSALQQYLTPERLEQEYRQVAEIEHPLVRIIAWSELVRAVSEALVELQIRFDQDTRDTERETQIATAEEIEAPISERWSIILRNGLLANFPDDPELTYLKRVLEVEARVACEANVPLDIELSSLSRRFQTLAGALRIEHDGAELTVEDAVPLFQAGDRPTRVALFDKVWGARKAISGEVEEIFLRGVSLNREGASNAGYREFLPYQFDAMGRLSYTPEDCQRFHRGIARHFKPLADALYRRIADERGVPTLRPADLSLGRIFELQSDVPPPPLAGTLDASTLILHKIDPELGKLLTRLQGLGLTDLEPRPGKTAGAFCHTLANRGEPYLFMNPLNNLADITTVLHEFGHGYHAKLSIGDPISPLLETPVEFAEVASMTMELFGYENFDGVLPPEVVSVLRQRMLQSIVLFLPYVSQVDLFQHWLYQQKNLTAGDLRRRWVELDEEFGAPLDWSGHEDTREIFWQQQHHIVCSPFYYIEYAIAQLGALQLWQAYRRNRKGTFAKYSRALKLGGTRPLEKLFYTAGITLRFDEDHFAPFAELLADELGL